MSTTTLETDIFTGLQYAFDAQRPELFKTLLMQLKENSIQDPASLSINELDVLPISKAKKDKKRHAINCWSSIASINPNELESIDHLRHLLTHTIKTYEAEHDLFSKVCNAY